MTGKLKGVTIAAGQTSVSFSFSPQSVTQTTYVTLTARYGLVKLQQTLQVTP